MDSINTTWWSSYANFGQYKWYSNSRIRLVASTKYKPVRNLNVGSVVLPFACAVVLMFVTSWNLIFLAVVHHYMTTYRDGKCNLFLIIVAGKSWLLILWYFKGSRLWLCCCVWLQFFCCRKVHVLFWTFNFYYTFARGKTPLLVYWHSSTNFIFAKISIYLTNWKWIGWKLVQSYLNLANHSYYGVWSFKYFIFLCIPGEDIMLHPFSLKVHFQIFMHFLGRQHWSIVVPYFFKIIASPPQNKNKNNLTVEKSELFSLFWLFYLTYHICCPHIANISNLLRGSLWTWK